MAPGKVYFFTALSLLVLTLNGQEPPAAPKPLDEPPSVASPNDPPPQPVSRPAGFETASGSTELRKHVVYRHPKDHRVLFEVTYITRSSEELSHSIVLVDDNGHGRILMENTYTYADQRVSYQISDVQRKDWVRAWFRMPYTATTRTQTREQSAASPQLGMTPVLIHLETIGGTWSGLESELDEWQRLREIRHSIRPTISFYVLEAIERMRGALFSSADASTYEQMIAQYVVFQSDHEAILEVEEVPAPPACDFDKSFGFACSEAQLGRIKAAAEQGKRLPRY